jgi:hypothetical protein
MGIALDAETENFARRLATLRGETVEQAVKMAVQAELARTEPLHSSPPSPARQASVDKMMSIVTSLPKIPFRDDEDPTVFLYDDRGLPC